MSAQSAARRPTAVVSADQLATRAGKAFLRGYVDANGRVIRHDQGGDTVSEGQAYAMLIAVALGDRATFARVWSWTAGHLQRADGQLAYHWAGGRVVDATPASDADTQAAWALALAGARFSQPALTAAGRRLAEAAVGADTGYTASGAPFLAAGPWAVRHGSASTAEPGYWAAPVDTALAALTGDHRYAGMASTQRGLLATLTHDGAQLPADWATVAGAEAVAVAAPGGGAGVQSGPDGERALVWAALDPGSARLAVAWRRLLRAGADTAPISRTLTGTVLQPDEAPLSAVAAAAVARVAGDPAGATRLLAHADRLAVAYPTYYGAAWDALGRLLLTTGRLSG